MDYKLKDGTEVTFDLDAFTYEEYFKIFNTEERDYLAEILSRSSGLDLERIKKLGYASRRAMELAFFKKCREPLSDPNSDSAPS